jgi:hypothetical protein
VAAQFRSRFLQLHSRLSGQEHYEGDASASHLPVWKAARVPSCSGVVEGPAPLPSRTSASLDGGRGPPTISLA